MNVVSVLSVAAFLTIATAWDSVYGTIPNKLNLTMCVLGLIFIVLTDGTDAVLHGIIGICIPVTVLYVLFVKGIIGAGDIKLFMALGAWFKEDVWRVMATSFVVIGAYGALRIMVRLMKQTWVAKRDHVKINLLQVLLEKSYVKLSGFIMVGTFMYMLLCLG